MPALVEERHAGRRLDPALPLLHDDVERHALVALADAVEPVEDLLARLAPGRDEEQERRPLDGLAGERGPAAGVDELEGRNGRRDRRAAEAAPAPVHAELRLRPLDDRRHPPQQSEHDRGQGEEADPERDEAGDPGPAHPSSPEALRAYETVSRRRSSASRTAVKPRTATVAAARRPTALPEETPCREPRPSTASRPNAAGASAVTTAAIASRPRFRTRVVQPMVREGPAP